MLNIYIEVYAKLMYNRLSRLAGFYFSRSLKIIVINEHFRFGACSSLLLLLQLDYFSNMNIREQNELIIVNRV